MESQTLTRAVYQQQTAICRFLTLPVEIRLHVYSYLLSDVCQSKDHRLACPAVLLTCRTIYLEAVSVLYHKRCFRFDIGGHRQGAGLNRHHRITMINFLDCGRPFYGPRLPGYVQSTILDYTRIEEICVNFWPVHGCPITLNEARKAINALCRNLRKASSLKKVSIVFHDHWPAALTTAANMTCRRMTDAEYLLQPFRVLRGIKEVHIEMPNEVVSDGDLETPFQQLHPANRTVQSQLGSMEETKSVMMGSLPSLAMY